MLLTHVCEMLCHLICVHVSMNLTLAIGCQLIGYLYEQHNHICNKLSQLYDTLT